MIDRILLRGYLSQARLLFCSLGLLLFAFAWVRVWVIKHLGMEKFQAVLDQFRDFEKFAPIDFDSIATYSGRVGMCFDEPVLIFCIVMWCIARGSDVVAGELGRGTLEMVLAQPITRSRLLTSHAVVSVAGLAGLCLIVWLGLTIGIHTTEITETVAPPSFQLSWLPFEIPLPASGEPETISFLLSERVTASMYTASVVNLFAFGFFVLGLSTLFSSIDRHRWRAIGCTVAVYVLQLIVFVLGKAAESLNWLQSYSFFTCYKPQKMTALVRDHGLSAPWSLTEVMPESAFPPLVYPLLLLSGGIAFYIAAYMVFNRRDLPAPI